MVSIVGAKIDHGSLLYWICVSELREVLFVAQGEEVSIG